VALANTGQNTVNPELLEKLMIKQQQLQEEKHAVAVVPESAHSSFNLVLAASNLIKHKKK
jgi:hypothetical protein